MATGEKFLSRLEQNQPIWLVGQARGLLCCDPILGGEDSSYKNGESYGFH